MTQNPQRFSGPELATLLSQVRNELGEDATIVEANRLRQGGFAGFFARQHFEVLATPRPADDDGADGGDLLHGGDPPDEGDPLGGVAGLRAGGHIDSLLDRAERVSSAERASPGPLAVHADPIGDRFSEVLRAALVETAIDVTEISPPAVGAAPSAPADRDGAPPAIAAVGPTVPLAGAAAAAPTPPLGAPPTVPPGRADGPPGAGPSGAAPVPPPAGAEPPPRSWAVDHAGSGDADTPGIAPWPAPAIRRRRVPPPSHVRAARDLATLPAGGFWSRLLRFEQLLDDTPLDAPVTVLVGPVDDAVAVARTVARAGGVDPVDVMVVSEASEVDGVPPWQLVAGGADVAQRVAYWRSTGRPAVVVVELSDRVGWTRDMVQAASGGLTRLVVRSLDDGHQLAATLRALPPVAALDLTRPPAPELLVPLVEHGVRIATVCGRPMTPMLLAGLTGTMDRG